MSQIKIYSFALISMTFWALSFVWYKDAFISYGPVTIIFFRLILSVSLLLIVTRIIRKDLRLEKKDYRYMALLSFFEPFCYFLGEGFGMQHVSPTTGAIIISTIPLITPFVLMLMNLKETIHFKNFLGMMISFAGIILVVTSDNASFAASLKGVSLLFVAVISAIFFSIILKKVGNRYNSMVIVFWQNIFSVLYFMPLFLALELESFMASSHEPAAYLAIIKLGTFPSTISFILFIPVVTYLGATKANAFANIIPVITAIFSYFYLGEQFSLLKILGVAAVITGLFFSQMRFIKTKIAEV
ncbi:MAG TPA: DMT family transporter [bacterium]|nr:DMT family transporter [bacterium]MDX9805625.1 DMT family transporter [bacterium]HNZ53301.1 DMT family transporter [bacterium]HOG43874.1 DMT family transporter [bacterium]HPM46278.1 DMT family transporter [bacterium]